MPRDFIPSTDAGLLAWGANYSALITATPTAYGLTAGLATTLAGKQSAYATAFAAAVDPATRGRATVLAKDTARADLVAYARLLARTVQGTSTVTSAQKFALGLTVRNVSPAPVPAPATAPDIDIISAIGRTVKIRLHDSASTTRRGKPAGVAGAAVFSFVGAAAPTDPAQWRFEGNATRTIVDITFADSVAAGAQVWLTAFWYNPRAQKGPGTPAVGTNIPGGSAMAA